MSEKAEMIDFRSLQGNQYDLLEQLGFEKPKAVERDYQPLYSYFNLNRTECSLSRVLFLGYEYEDKYTVPEYQRDLVWTLEQKQALAESIILGNPIGDFIANELVLDKDGNREYRLIDGQQRINTLREFVSGHFPTKSSIKLTVKQEVQIYLGRNCGGTMHTAEEINKAASFLKN